MAQEALLAIFKLIDADSSGSISKLELIGAVYRDFGKTGMGKCTGKPWNTPEIKGKPWKNWRLSG